MNLFTCNDPSTRARGRLERARKEEITARKFRNHMRDMLSLLDGASSKRSHYPTARPSRLIPLPTAEAPRWA
jgi:hypothetical protein